MQLTMPAAATSASTEKLSNEGPRLAPAPLLEAGLSGLFPPSFGHSLPAAAPVATPVNPPSGSEPAFPGADPKESWTATRAFHLRDLHAGTLPSGRSPETTLPARHMALPAGNALAIDADPQIQVIENTAPVRGASLQAAAAVETVPCLLGPALALHIPGFPGPASTPSGRRNT